VSCARCRGRHEAPSGGSSRKGELRGRVGLSRSPQRSVNVITTDPLVEELLLREGGDSPLFHLWLNVVLQLECGWRHLWAQFDCGESVTVLAEGCGGWV
jgi:hypothetical protein